MRRAHRSRLIAAADDASIQRCQSVCIVGNARAAKDIIVAPEMLCMHRYNRRGWPPMGYRIRRAVATWVAVAALLFQVFLPFGLAAGPGVDGPGTLLEADHHYHDPGLANAYGRDWASRHSHTGGGPSCRLRLDLAYAPPFTAINPPALPAAALHWVAFVADWMASAPSADEAFSRPLPRAPPLPA
jgi:hypothetical protein